MKKICWLFTVCASLVISGCASSAVIVTGTVRDPINLNDVKIVTSIPENAEEIAIIKASSDAGFTEQQCYDYVVKELKSRAARLGGNAILIENMGSKNTAYYYSNSFIIPYDEQFITGKVLYIPDSGSASVK